MQKRTPKRAVAALLFSTLAAVAGSDFAFAGGPGGGGGGHGGAGGHAGGGHFGGGAHGGYGGRGGYGARGGYRGGYGGRGGYGYRGGYGGWGWGGVGLGLGLYFATLPFYYATYLGADGLPYYYADDNYYQWQGNANAYQTVSPPPDVQRQVEAQSPNLMAYPKNGQSDAQQAADKTACRTWATAQSGFDPSQGAPTAGAPPQEASAKSSIKRSDYLRAQAACFEGRGYSVK